MKQIIILFGLSLFVLASSFAQQRGIYYNLEFKDIHENIPKGWEIVEGKKDAFQFEEDKSRYGLPVLKITSHSNVQDESNVLQLEIPDNLKGKELSLEADIRTQDMGENGVVGYFLGIQPKVAYENIREDYKGTNEWTRHHIRVQMSPKETKKIILGLYLLGKGTAWFKNLTLKVDGEDYTKAKIYTPKIPSDTTYVFESHIPTFKLTANRVNRLKATAQIWGLIKYFHPAVAQGKWDMDTELFKFFPAILDNQTEVQFDHDLQNWISHFGEYRKKSISAVKSDRIKMEADFNWINQLSYSKQLKDELHNLTQTTLPVDHQNIDFFDGPNNVSIQEYKYTTVPFSDVGFRLLGLFRYWNIMQYYNPYRYLLSAEWDKQLQTFIPIFVNSNSVAALDQAYLKLFAVIKDSHAFAELSSPYHQTVFGDRTVGFKIKIMGNKAVIVSRGADSLSFDGAVQIGDVITDINGKSASDLISLIKPFIAGSNDAIVLRDIAPRMLQTKESALALNVLRNGKKIQLTVPTRAIRDITPIVDQDTSSYCIIDKQIGYLNAGKFTEDKVALFWDAIKNTKGLIIDYRHYPIDNHHQNLSKYLFPLEKEFVRFTVNRGFTPGEFQFRDSSIVGQNNLGNYKGKIIILVNEDTQSAAEFQTMAFQTIPGSVVIGSTTSGADGNISWIPLPSGYRTAFSAIGIYYPDGRETQGVGIIPDIEVKPTINGVKAGQDEVLNKAISYINKLVL